MAMRCRCPPESVEGYTSALSERPMRSKRRMAVASAFAFISLTVYGKSRSGFFSLRNTLAILVKKFFLLTVRIFFLPICTGAIVMFFFTVMLLNRLNC